MYQHTEFKNSMGTLVVVHSVSFNNGDSIEFQRSSFGGIIRFFRNGTMIDRMSDSFKKTYNRFCLAKERQSIYF